MARVIYREDKWGQGFLMASLLHWLIILLLFWAWTTYQRSYTDAQDRFCLIIDKAPILFKVPGKSVFRNLERPKPRPFFPPRRITPPPMARPAQTLAPTPQQPQRVAPPPPPPQTAMERSDYLKELLYQVEVNRHYPPQSVRYGEEGVVGVRFKIQPNGDLTDIRVIKSSGLPRLDQGALEAVANTSPYKPIPQEYLQQLRQQGLSAWQINVNIDYNLKDAR